MSRRSRRRNKKRKEVQMKSQSLREEDLLSSLIIREDVYRKVMFWVNKADTEVSGLGSIEIIDGVPTVIDAFLVDQECSGSETELDATALCKAMYDYEATKKPGEIRWWWHSHVDMPVFWSPTDYAAIEQLGRNGWFLSTVFNKKHEFRSVFYGITPFKVFLDEINTEVMSTIPQSLHDAWVSEFQSKVKKQKPVTYLGHVGNLDLGGDDHFLDTHTIEKLNNRYLVTTGLLDYHVKEIEELRTRGWDDLSIAEYMELEDRLVEGLEPLDDYSEDIELMRRDGIPETDIQEMMKVKRGVSGAI